MDSKWLNPLYPTETERNPDLELRLEPDGQRSAFDVGVTAYHTSTELQQDGRYGLYIGDTRSAGLDVRNTSELGAHRLTYGIDYRDDQTRLGPDGDRNWMKRMATFWDSMCGTAIR